jgi:8-oxo-dGTP pyrophosphatase MutT (NUDIX family)
VTALVLAFAGDRLLQTQLVKRGWDLVGGHIEPGESPEEAVRREAYEETGARLGQLHLLGYQHLRLSGSRPDNYRYPYPESYQIFYYAQIVALDDILANQETQGRGLFSPEEAASLPWVQAHRSLYLAALATATGQENQDIG